MKETCLRLTNTPEDSMEMKPVKKTELPKEEYSKLKNILIQIAHSSTKKEAEPLIVHARFAQASLRDILDDHSRQNLARTINRASAAASATKQNLERIEKFNVALRLFEKLINPV
jgi:hypothetical protein